MMMDRESSLHGKSPRLFAAVALWLGLLTFGVMAQAPAETNLPLTTIRTFLDQSRAWGEQAQVRLRGTVAHSTSDKTFFIQDGDAGVYVFHRPARPFTNGALVEVIANPSLGGVSPTLQNCTATQIGSPNRFPSAEPRR
jgi:hypothetical protein